MRTPIWRYYLKQAMGREKLSLIMTKTVGTHSLRSQ